jgi:hypothetical protein
MFGPQGDLQLDRQYPAVDCAWTASGLRVSLFGPCDPI